MHFRKRDYLRMLDNMLNDCRVCPLYPAYEEGSLYTKYRLRKQFYRFSQTYTSDWDRVTAYLKRGHL